jgi:hypothetical protein
LRRIVRGFQSRIHNNGGRVWHLVLLEHWLREFEPAVD